MNLKFSNSHFAIGFCLLLTTLFIFNSCRKANDGEPTKFDITFVALTDDNNLLTLNSDITLKNAVKVAITGTVAGEKILGIDFRPATGLLYGVSNMSKLYVINPSTGTARAIGTSAFTPAINGSVVGLDFNPTVDRIRLVTSLGQNLRLNPETGVVAATDGALNPGSPTVSEVAYTNNRAGATTTILYTIDPTTDKLYRQDPPNAGTLVEVGSLGVDVNGAVGFDITSADFALAALRVGGVSSLFTINLTTGRVLKLSDFDSNVNIIGLAIPTEPVAYMVDNTNNLIILNPFSEEVPNVSKPITGLQTGENILGLDMRPANGQLYALGSTSRLYTINAATGAATAVGTTPFATLLNGTSFGFDFNPVVDRVRIVSNLGQNLRANPETGAIASVDSSLNSNTNFSVSAAAYSNNFAGATSTTLYVLDPSSKKLFIQNPPNNGTLINVANLNDSYSNANGFDIGGTSGRAYLVLNNESNMKLYKLNLETGFLTPIRNLSESSTRGFTIGLGF